LLQDSVLKFTLCREAGVDCESVEQRKL